MPLEHLEKLFEEIGRAAEQASKISGGGRVAQSETVRSVADLYHQLGKIGPSTYFVSTVERLQKQMEQLSKSRQIQDTSPQRGVHHWLDPLARFSHHVQKLQEAGQAVDRFTYSLASAARFLYSFATGRIVMPSGRTVPWRRVLASRLRGARWAKPLRKALLAPDIALHKTRQTLRAARQTPRTRLARLDAIRSVTAPRAAAGAEAGAGATAAGATGTAAAGATGAAAARAAGAAAAAETTGATAAGTGATAAGTGAAAAGATGALAAAGPVGIAVAAILLVVAAFGLAVAALYKFNQAVLSASETMLAKRFERYADWNPQIAYAQARLEAYDIGTRIRTGQATAQSTLALTESLIALKQELEPIQAGLIIFANYLMTGVVQIARLVTWMAKLSPMLNGILYFLSAMAKSEQLKTAKFEFPYARFLRFLEEAEKPHWFNPPPGGGKPPWS